MQCKWENCACSKFIQQTNLKFCTLLQLIKLLKSIKLPNAVITVHTSLFAYQLIISHDHEQSEI